MARFVWVWIVKITIVIFDTPYGEYLHCASTRDLDAARRAFTACYRRNPEIKPQWETLRSVTAKELLDEKARLKAKYPNRKPLKAIFGSPEKMFEYGHLLPGSRLKPAPHLKQVVSEKPIASSEWGSLSRW